MPAIAPTATIVTVVAAAMVIVRSSLGSFPAEVLVPVGKGVGSDTGLIDGMLVTGDIVGTFVLNVGFAEGSNVVGTLVGDSELGD
mmetsp:Transcript_10367/g.11902  ORF Transcript_10367/g.11902 Transcript_10367/m.11902 type:complete len:85 (-) Transcript_10367:387-641(-)